MSDKVVLQVPMSKQVKIEAQKAALDLGFSSLQETVRVFLKRLSRREIGITVQKEEIVNLSPRAEKRYKKAIEDIKHARNITKTKNVDELLTLLHS